MPQFTPFLEQIQYLLDTCLLRGFQGKTPYMLLTLERIHILDSFFFFFNSKKQRKQNQQEANKERKAAKIELLIPSVSMA